MTLERIDSISQNPLQEKKSPIPKPRSEEIQVQVRACGICRTDLHIIEGELIPKKIPVIPGHQIIGVVREQGQNTKIFELGQRVGIPWLHRTCEHCHFCQTGRENLCKQAEFTGYTVDGGYAEYTLIPEKFAYPIPDNFSDAEATPLLCAGTIGYRSLKLSKIHSGQRLGLYGFGQSAHIAIQVACHWGCEVYVFTRSKTHRQLALQLGATWVGRAEDSPPKTIHSAIIFAPAGNLVPQALKILERGGTLALAGIHMSPIPPLHYSSLYQERTIRSVTNLTRQDARELLALAGKIPIQTRVESFPLNQANQALQKLKNSEINGAAALVID